MNVVSGYLSLDSLADIQLPCILHWNQKHFVVLYKIRKNRLFYIADPGKGLLRYSMDEFKKNWINIQYKGEEKGVAMILIPEDKFELGNMVYQEGNKDTGNEFKFLRRYLNKYCRYFCLITKVSHPSLNGV